MKFILFILKSFITIYKEDILICIYISLF